MNSNLARYLAAVKARASTTMRADAGAAPPGVVDQWSRSSTTVADVEQLIALVEALAKVAEAARDYVATIDDNQEALEKTFGYVPDYHVSNEDKFEWPIRAALAECDATVARVTKGGTT